MKTASALRRRILFFLLYPIISSSAFLFAEQEAPQKSEPLARPAPEIIEDSLLVLINEERGKQGLPGLRLSPALTQLARKHSQDMAARDKLSHLSREGGACLDRLFGEGFFFGRMGENVARSETFASRWIHQSLMDSPEHRENILDPAFDEVGIGVVDQGKTCYFITQDFIQSLETTSVEEARKAVVSKILAIRLEHKLPPIKITENKNQLAQLFAHARAEGQPPPPFPEGLGEMLVFYMATPFLDNFER